MIGVLAWPPPPGSEWGGGGCNWRSTVRIGLGPAPSQVHLNPEHGRPRELGCGLMPLPCSVGQDPWVPCLGKGSLYALIRCWGALVVTGDLWKWAAVAVPQKLLLVVSHSDGSLCIMVTRKIDCGVPSCCWYCEVEAVCCSPEGSKRNLAVWDLTDGQRIIKGNVAQHGLERLLRYNHRRLLLYLSVYISASPFKNCTVKFPKYTLPHVAKTQVVLPMCFFPHRIYDEVCADFLDG